VFLVNNFPSRKSAMTAHPDKGGSEAKMAEVNEAYEVLSNPGKNSKLNVFAYLAHLIVQNYANASTMGMTQMILVLTEALHLLDSLVSSVVVVESIHLRTFSSKLGSAVSRLGEANNIGSDSIILLSQSNVNPLWIVAVLYPSPISISFRVEILNLDRPFANVWLGFRQCCACSLELYSSEVFMSTLRHF
jgi:curved DNA-binding protein CbpA